MNLSLSIYSEWTSWTFGLPNEELDKGIGLFLSRLQDREYESGTASLSLYAIGQKSAKTTIVPVTCSIEMNGNVPSPCSNVDIGKIPSSQSFYAARPTEVGLEDSFGSLNLQEVHDSIRNSLRSSTADKKLGLIFFLRGAGIQSLYLGDDERRAPLFQQAIVHVDSQNDSELSKESWKTVGKPVFLMEGFKYVEFFDYLSTQIIEMIENPGKSTLSRTVSYTHLTLPTIYSV